MNKPRSKPSYLLPALVLPALLLLLLKPADYSLRLTPQSLLDKSFAVNLEQYVREHIPLSDQLRLLALDIDMLGGRRERDNIIVGSNVLLKNIGTVNQSLTDANTRAVLEFSDYCETVGLPLHLALIPTSAAILREDLPPFFTAADQRALIDAVYNQCSGRVSTVDVYAPLLSLRDQYIYYRTENNLTPTGGFIVFQTLAARMLGVQAPSFNQFEIAYTSTPFYGDMYKTAPARGVQPDILMLPYYSRQNRTFTVIHYQPGGTKIYHTLYPTHLIDLGQEMNVYFGGLSAVTDLRSSAAGGRRLLIFGDQTALAYVPYMANYYSQITIIDLFHDTARYTGVSLAQYNQVLIAYSAETYMNNSYLSRVLEFIPS